MIISHPPSDSLSLSHQLYFSYSLMFSFLATRGRLLAFERAQQKKTNLYIHAFINWSTLKANVDRPGAEYLITVLYSYFSLQYLRSVASPCPVLPKLFGVTLVSGGRASWSWHRIISATRQLTQLRLPYRTQRTPIPMASSPSRHATTHEAVMTTTMSVDVRGSPSSSSSSSPVHCLVVICFTCWLFTVVGSSNSVVPELVDVISVWSVVTSYLFTTHRNSQNPQNWAPTPVTLKQNTTVCR